MLGFFRRHRRASLRVRPFPPAWLEVLERNVPYYLTLSPADRGELRGHVQVFLAEKRFEGAGGLEMTDEIRVTIAAQACVLLLHRESEYYPGLISIVVYPGAYVAGNGPRIGESWIQGTVVLAWDAVLRHAADVHDGRNVVFHEFAHQLDQEDRVSDGAPVLERRSQYIAWARVLGHEYRKLQRDERGRETVLDRYGAESPAEFFAVATEAFFTRPGDLLRKHPGLYRQLAGFYRQDPAQRDPGRMGESPPPTSTGVDPLGARR